MNTADTLIYLDNDILTDFPWACYHGDDEIGVRNLSERTVDYRPIERDLRPKIIGQRIADVIGFDGGLFQHKAMLVFENGVLITSVLTAMQGTSHEGVWCFDSINDLESRWGSDYQRLIDRPHE